jgi:hypothetical protein
VEVALLEVLEVDDEVGKEAASDRPLVVVVVKGASELPTETVAEPVDTASVVVGFAIVVLMSENTVAVIVLCVFGIAPATESHI